MPETNCDICLTDKTLTFVSIANIVATSKKFKIEAIGHDRIYACLDTDPSATFINNVYSTCLSPLSCEGAISKVILPEGLDYGDEDVIYWDIKVGDTLYPLQADGWKGTDYLEDMVNEHEILSQLLLVLWKSEGLIFMNKTQDLLKISLIASQDITDKASHDGSNPTAVINGAKINFCLNKAIPEIDLRSPVGGIYFPYTPYIQGDVVVGMVSGDILEIEVSSPTMPTQTVSVTVNDDGDIGDNLIDLSNYPVGEEVQLKATKINGSVNLVSNTLFGKIEPREFGVWRNTDGVDYNHMPEKVVYSEDVQLAMTRRFGGYDEPAYLYHTVDGENWNEVGLSALGITNPFKVINIEYMNGKFWAYSIQLPVFDRVRPFRSSDPRFVSTSDDGLTWETFPLTTNREYSSTGFNNFDGFIPYNVVYGNGVYVTSEGDGFQYSIDGKSFSKVNGVAEGSAGFEIIFDGEKFISTSAKVTGVTIRHLTPNLVTSVLSNNAHTLTIHTSSDGINWSTALLRENLPKEIVPNKILPNARIFSAGGVYFTGNLTSSTYMSNDGVNWRVWDYNSPLSRIADVKFTDGRYVAIGVEYMSDGSESYVVKNVTVYSSPNAIDWTGFVFSGMIDFHAMFTYDYLFLLSGFVNDGITPRQSRVYSSPDGVSWKRVSTPNLTTLRSDETDAVFKDKLFSWDNNVLYVGAYL